MFFVTYRRVTSVMVANLSNAEKEMAKVDFVENVNERIQDFKLNLNDVLNMDQTGVYFGEKGKTTIHKSGMKHIFSKELMGDKMHCTVFLAGTLGGIKLMPLIIFKGSPNGLVSREVGKENLGYPQDCLNGVQENAWCDIVFY